MPSCPACRAEYREGFATCADCGVTLVDALPPAISSLPLVVFEGSYARAFAFRAFLEENGVRAEIEDEFTWNHVPGMSAPLRVVASEHDRALVEEARAEWGQPAEDTEPWAPGAPRYWHAPLASAALLLGLPLAMSAKPWFSAAAAWFVLQAAAVGRHGRIFGVGVFYGAVVAFGLGFAYPPLFRLVGESGAARNFLVVAPMEEVLKLLGPFILFSGVKGGTRSEWLSLAGSSALGFATLENFIYLGGGQGDIGDLFLSRAGSFSHVAMTLFVAAGSPARLLPAIVLHAVWNCLCGEESRDLGWAHLLVFAAELWLWRRGTRVA